VVRDKMDKVRDLFEAAAEQEAPKMTSFMDVIDRAIKVYFWSISWSLLVTPI
jgi:hypothetical protein